ARAVGSQKSGRSLRRYCPALRQLASVWVYPETRYRWHRTMSDVEYLLVRAESQRGRPTRHRHLALWRQVTGLRLHRKSPYLVLILEGNVQRVWHGLTSSVCACASRCRRRASASDKSQRLDLDLAELYDPLILHDARAVLQCDLSTRELAVLHAVDGLLA